MRERHSRQKRQADTNTQTEYKKEWDLNGTCRSQIATALHVSVEVQLCTCGSAFFRVCIHSYSHDRHKQTQRKAQGKVIDKRHRCKYTDRIQKEWDL